MIIISQASPKDIPIIQEIAEKTWPDTYGAILSKVQLEFMMAMMYSVTALELQFKKQHHFYLAHEEGVCLGFASCENRYLNNKVTRIHKIYILPTAQGKGIGKELIEIIKKTAQENQSVVMSLNVNRYNRALSFYQKLGFEIIGQEDIEIGGGYLMEDFKMEFKLG